MIVMKPQKHDDVIDERSDDSDDDINDIGKPVKSININDIVWPMAY